MVAIRHSLIVVILMVLASNASEICLRKSRLLDRNLNFTDIVLKEPVISEECKSKRICNEVPNYPDDLVTRLLTELNKKSITKCIIETNHGYEDSVPFCSTAGTVVPRAARNSTGTWHYILNPESGRPFQAFQVNTCNTKTEDKKCHVHNSEYDVICDQKEVYKVMVYLNMETKMLDLGYFAVPNCCSCSLREKVITHEYY